MRAKILLGCYRTGDANDPETYIAAITAVLARYPEQIITSVTHPVSGLPAKKSWLPTIKEVVDACDAEYAPIANNEARLKRIKEQLEMREREDRGEKPTLAQLHDKYGKDWGLTPTGPKRVDDFKAPSWQAIVSMYSADPSRIQRLMTSDLTARHEGESDGTNYDKMQFD